MNNMEGDSMPECKHCHIPMEVKGTRWECPDCDYGYTIPIKMPSYMELLKENTDLRKRIEELTQNHLSKATKSKSSGV